MEHSKAVSTAPRARSSRERNSSKLDRRNSSSGSHKGNLRLLPFMDKEAEEQLARRSLQPVHNKQGKADLKGKQGNSSLGAREILQTRGAPITRPAVNGKEESGGKQLAKIRPLLRSVLGHRKRPWRPSRRSSV